MKTFNCPSCSGPLTYDESADKVIECRFCGQSVMVPEGWRRKARVVGSGAASGIARGIAIMAVVISVVVGITIVFVTQSVERVAAPASPPVEITLPPSVTSQLEQLTGEPEGFRVVRAFGDEGTGPGRFKDARSIALDQQGHLYVAEYSGGRIQRFDTTGKFLSQWIANPETPLRALVAGRDGIVYVVQRGVIERYEGATGEPLEPLPRPGRRRYDDAYPMADGGLVAVAGTGWDGEIVRLDAQGRDRVSFGIESLNMQVAADGLGYIYVLGRYRDRGTSGKAIFKYDPEGQFINRFGGEGDEPGQFKAPHTLAVDGQGRVYVSDIKGIQVFDGDGRYLRTLRAGRSIFGMAFDDAGDLYIVERNSHQVQKIRIDGP